MAKVKEQLKIGVVGLGGRGTSLLEAVMIPMEDISIIGVCDKYEDRRMHAAQMVKEKKGNEPLCTADYKEILALGELDALYSRRATL